MIAAAVLLAVVASTPPPTFVVERVVLVGGETRRLSVFRDGTAVLATGPARGEKHVLRQTLSSIESGVVAQVVEECYPEVARFASVGQAPGDASFELRLAPPGRAPLDVKLPLTAARTLGVARLVQALDNLEARLARETVPREDFSGWQPAVGDRVQLDDGRVVEVVEVLEADDKRVVRVQLGDGPASMFLAEDYLRRAAVRRVPR